MTICPDTGSGRTSGQLKKRELFPGHTARAGPSRSQSPHLCTHTSANERRMNAAQQRGIVSKSDGSSTGWGVERTNVSELIETLFDHDVGHAHYSLRCHAAAEHVPRRPPCDQQAVRSGHRSLCKGRPAAAAAGSSVRSSDGGDTAAAAAAGPAGAHGICPALAGWAAAAAAAVA